MVWIATVLLSAMTAGLFVCVPSIPLITGPARTGLGYGLYAVFGNIIDGFNAYIAGVLISTGDMAFILYSLGFVTIGFGCWVLVYFLEKDMSFLERPTQNIVTTRLDDLVSASICGLLHSDGDGEGEDADSKEEIDGLLDTEEAEEVDGTKENDVDETDAKELARDEDALSKEEIDGPLEIVEADAGSKYADETRKQSAGSVLPLPAQEPVSAGEGADEVDDGKEETYEGSADSV